MEQDLRGRDCAGHERGQYRGDPVRSQGADRRRVCRDRDLANVRRGHAAEPESGAAGTRRISATAPDRIQRGAYLLLRFWALAL